MAETIDTLIVTLFYQKYKRYEHARRNGEYLSISEKTMLEVRIVVSKS